MSAKRGPGRAGGGPAEVDLDLMDSYLGPAAAARIAHATGMVEQLSGGHPAPWTEGGTDDPVNAFIQDAPNAADRRARNAALDHSAQQLLVWLIAECDGVAEALRDIAPRLQV